MYQDCFRRFRICLVVTISLALLTTACAFAQTYKFTSFDVPGSVSTRPLGINSRGDLVGSYRDGDKHTHGWVLSKGNYTILDVPGSLATIASGINSSGTVSGYFVDADTSNAPCLHPEQQRFQHL